MEGTGSPPADASEDVPHARGPRVLGVEDLGLQDGKGVEMTLPAAEENPNKQSEQQEQTDQPAPEHDTKQAAGKEKADGDGDIVLGDIQGAGEQQQPVSDETKKSDQ